MVFGGSKYKYFLPPKSYINVADYSSVMKLTNYLKYLSHHPREYIKYFWWKNFYRIERTGRSGRQFCQLCEFLHLKKRKHKVKIYKSISKYDDPFFFFDFTNVLRESENLIFEFFIYPWNALKLHFLSVYYIIHFFRWIAGSKVCDYNSRLPIQ